MEKLTTKEFIEQLNSNSFKQTFGIKGIVKKSGNDTEVQFAFKGDFSKWHSIPSSMIESVVVIKTFVKAGETYVVAKLTLKAPTSPETKVIYDMLESAVEEHHFTKEGLVDHMHHFMHHLHQRGQVCPKCGCHKGCKCGCHDGCKCDCHKHE